ncbi:hypothetical protein Tdes44962_MAKER00477 [Teratosphaeria destructans]|uniref:DUF7728 domain-containing protein n=1 Tax=Teratosphaeria destructans TaxID=418781 RepID=A0A9W7SQK3_9PEZI|nr:hypothetical protein Tdes44962_MAKER00477 [Teratosphaeria destructans]
MFGRTVGILCAACAGAAALIVPPGVASNHDLPDLRVTILDPKRSTLTVPCGGCAFPMGEPGDAAAEQAEEDVVWIQGGANSLLMDFEVSEDGKALHLNGEPIYPVFSQTGESIFDQKTIHVKQVPSTVGLVDIKNGNTRSADLEVTAYGLRQEGAETLSPNGDKVVPLTLQIMGLNNEFMHVDDVVVTLLQTSDDEFLILETGVKVTSVDDLPPSHFLNDGPPRPHHDTSEDEDDHSPPRPHGPPHHFQQGNHKECNLLPAPLCRLKKLMEEKIDLAMGVPPHGPRPHGGRRGGCRGHMGGGRGKDGKLLPGHMKGGRPPFLEDAEHAEFKHPEIQADMEGKEPGRPHHGRPHHGRPHGEQHHHHHGFFPGQHFAHAFLKGLVAILIPVVAGITVGMTVSLVGLVVGRIIGFVWIHVARGGRRGSASVTLRDAPVMEEDEKKALLVEMDAEEALPVYEDAPAYVEAVEKTGQ